MLRMSEMKKLAAALLSASVLFSFPCLCYAGEGQAIGNFADDETEESETESEDTQTGGNQVISLSNDVGYNQATGLFYYSVENSSFGISVPDGAIVTGTVRASLSVALTGVLYKNGVVMEDANLADITAPGKYVLAVTANDENQTTRVSFTIVSSPTGEIKEYRMPTDFYVVSATLNGEETAFSQTYVDMSSDGDYVINYRSPEAGLDMELKITIDHTAPTVTLSGIVDGKSNEPVIVSDVEEGAKLYLERNNEEITYTDTISQTGSYVLTVQDQAGNETIYDFVVVTYANGSAKGLIVAVIVLAVAVLGYIIYYRKYIRVR